MPAISAGVARDRACSVYGALACANAADSGRVIPEQCRNPGEVEPEVSEMGWSPGRGRHGLFMLGEARSRQPFPRVKIRAKAARPAAARGRVGAALS
jgi:hypothetical protein